MHFDPAKLNTFARLKLKQAANIGMQSYFLQSNFTGDEEKRKMPVLTCSAAINRKTSACGSKPGSPQLNKTQLAEVC